MTAHEQTDIFGGSIPLEELELAGHSRALAAHERETGTRLSADEAGAIIHARRGKHPLDARCVWCNPDGTEALFNLNVHRRKIREREQAATKPPWRCTDCGRENSADRTLCGGCASSPLDDREPPLGEKAYDPSTAPFPAGY